MRPSTIISFLAAIVTLVIVYSASNGHHRLLHQVPGWSATPLKVVRGRGWEKDIKSALGIGSCDVPIERKYAFLRKIVADCCIRLNIDAIHPCRHKGATLRKVFLGLSSLHILVLVSQKASIDKLSALSDVEPLLCRTGNTHLRCV